MNPTDKAAHANPSKNRSPRHRAREFALQGLYQWLLNDADASSVANNIRAAHGFDKADAEHFSALLTGTIRDANALRAAIAPLGAYELKNHIEIPYRVVINEAVELTKSFGGIDGHKYVNGVLDKLAAKMRETEVAADKRR